MNEMLSSKNDSGEDIEEATVVTSRSSSYNRTRLIVFGAVAMVLLVGVLAIRGSGNSETSATGSNQSQVENSTKAQELVLEAVDLVEAERYDEAMALLKEAGELDQANPLVFYNIGVIHHFSGQLDEAAQSYTQALSVDNRLSSAYYNRGLIRRDKGDLREAVADLEIAAALSPNNAAAHYNLGQVLTSLGETEAATRALEKARQIDPTIGIG